MHGVAYFVLHNHSYNNNLNRIHATMAEGKPVIDVDGSYLYRKQQKQTTEITATRTALPSEPLAGWESITADNCEDMAKKIPPVMPGIHIAFYSYM